jgi:hypothetical protein
LRDFLGVGLEGAPPDHSTISRTRRLIFERSVLLADLRRGVQASCGACVTRSVTIGSERDERDATERGALGGPI